MRESRGSSRPTIDKLAEWETRAFPALRRQRETGTPVDDLLPADPIAEPEAARRALDQLREL